MGLFPCPAAGPENFSGCCTAAGNFSLHSRKECREFFTGGFSIPPRPAWRPPGGGAGPLRKRGIFLNTTTNYQLSQWESADRILMSDFNGDNAKIDAALAAHDTALAGKAAASALPQFVTGSYVGTGEASVTKHYSLGFRPRLVIMRTDNINDDNTYDVGYLLTEAGCVLFNSRGEADLEAPGANAGLEDDGFFITHNKYANRGLNNTGKTLTYWAWK